MSKEGIRIENYSSVSTTTAVKVAEANPKRFKLKIRSRGANGHILSYDQNVNSTKAYFLPQNEEIEFEKYLGPVYALSVSAATDLCVLEEDM